MSCPYLYPQTEQNIMDLYFNGKAIPEKLYLYLARKYSGISFFINAADIDDCIYADVERYLEGSLPLDTVFDHRELEERIEELQKEADRYQSIIAEQNDMEYCNESEDNEEVYKLISLIIQMISHICYLTKEIVALRYVASFSMDEYHGETVRAEIFSGLSGSFQFDSIYASFLSKYADGRDPLEEAGYLHTLKKLAEGRYCENCHCNYAVLME